MKTLALLVPLAATSLTWAAPVPQDAQEPAVAVQTLPAARTIVDGYLRAIGFTEKLPAVQSIHTSGKLELVGMGIGGTVETYQARPNLNLTVADIEGMGENTNGFDGSVAWMNQGMLGPMVLDGVAAAQMAAGAAFDAQLYPADLFEKLETVDRVEFEGQACWKVEVVLKPFKSDDPNVADPEKTLAARTSLQYFAVDGGLLVGQEMTQASPMGDTKVTVVMSEYKDFDGVKMPTKVLQRVPGVEIKITLTAVVFDDVKEDRFVLPPEIQAILEKDKDAGGK